MYLHVYFSSIGNVELSKKFIVNVHSHVSARVTPKIE